MATFRVQVLLVALLIAASAASAHHSVSAVFDHSKHIKLTGTISKVDWINPHVIVYLDVKDEAGQVATWRLESVPTAFMRRAKLTADMIKGDGKPVTVDGIPAYDSSKHFMFLNKITYSDGHFYQLYLFDSDGDRP
jgi:hypothetical protein